ncbi:uncharacterized protein BXIN_2050 [Babesia sp. Xinjiang]|uniref:uncharacterized protein n=1 Tax=Babesia sp. Xinjiang TaxID=462227 RepID=UPI000A24E6A0|nr:uncharacterized protein BXIN_2050 [Babesia sp. Xinjiang]ORM40567.1 hypothetical protein BXIN_2050 [Babesia sp. Xinjiang]
MGPYLWVMILCAALETQAGILDFKTHEVYDFQKLDFPNDFNSVTVHLSVLKKGKTIEILCPRRRNGITFNLLPNTVETITDGDIFAYATLDGVYQKINMNQIIVTDNPPNYDHPEYRLGVSRLVINHHGIALYRRRNFDSFDLHCSSAVYVKTVAESLTPCLGDPNSAGNPSIKCPCIGCVKPGAPLLGIIRIMITDLPVLIRGCGTMRIPLLIDEINNDTDIPRSCSVDVMEARTVGFYCRGRVEPPDCPTRMFDSVNHRSMRIPFNFDVTSESYEGGTLLVMTYNVSTVTLPFSGYCKCVDLVSTLTNAVITMKNNEEYICNIGELLFRHLSNPIVGDWCDVTLYPGGRLNIIFPVNEESALHKTTGMGKPNVIILSSTLIPDEPSKNGLTRNVSNNVHQYMPISLEPLYKNGFLELEESLNDLGIVILKHLHNLNSSSRLDVGHFYYRCLFTILTDNMTIVRVRATIKITLTPQKNYKIVYEEESPTFCNAGDIHGSEKNQLKTREHLTPQIHEYYAEGKRHKALYCHNGEQLVPSECTKVAFNAEKASVVPLPASVIVRYHPLVDSMREIVVNGTGSAVFSISCSCVNTDGIETSRFEIHGLRQNTFVNGFPNRTMTSVIMIPHVEMFHIGRQEVRFSVKKIPIPEIIEMEDEIRLNIGDKISLKCNPPMDYKNRLRVSVRFDNKPFREKAESTILDLNETTEKIITSPYEDPSFSRSVWFPLSADEFFTPVRSNSNSELHSTGVDDVMVGLLGFKIETHYDLGLGSIDRSRLTIKYPQSAIVLSKMGESEVVLHYVCGSISPGRNLRSQDIDSLETPERRRFIFKDDRSLEIWEMVKIIFPTTDPYVRGCGLPGDMAQLFRPDTVLLRDEAGSVVGCDVDLKRTHVAGFYCPLPYRTDPPDCRPIPGTLRKSFMGGNLLNLRVKRSKHFYLFTKTKGCDITAKFLRKSDATTFECHCLTITGKRITTIKLRNF